MPETSIAMTTYNGSRFLQRQLDSLSNQSKPPGELIVCDDASSDDTVSILQAFAGKANFPVTVVVNSENVGYIQNFSNAIKLCRGDLIFLCDQDDIWHEDKLKYFTEVADKFTSKPALFFSDAQLIDAEGNPLKQTLWKILNISSSEQDYSVLSSKNIITGATCAINRKLVQKLDSFVAPPNVPHDYTFALFAWAVGEIVGIDKRLVSYRIHSGNAIGINRNIMDKFRMAYKMHNSRYTEDEGRRCQEIAALLQNVDSSKAKPFWRKAAFYRLINCASFCSFISIAYKYYSNVFPHKLPLVRIILSNYPRRLFPAKKASLTK